MSRMRVEGLLAAFPKLMGSGKTKQHQYIDTDTVRYIYQPVESLFILLITNRASNIVEDLETLRLLSKVVPEVAGGLTEERVCDAVFDLIFAFDEVLTSGGYKEGIPLSTVKSNLEMESHEEKLHMMIKQSKEDAAKDEMKRQAKAIKERQLNMMKQQLSGGPSMNMGGMQGFGGGGGGGGGGGANDPFGMMGMTDPYRSQGMGGGGGDYGNPASFDPNAGRAVEAPSAPRVVAKGMKLGGGGKKGKKDDLMNMMAAEDGLSNMGLAPTRGQAGAMEAVAAPPAAPLHPVTLAVEEKVSVSMSAEGEVQSCELKGTLSLTANSEEGAAVQVGINKGMLEGGPVQFTVNTHPKMDKKAWEKEGKLSIKGGKSIPVGRPIGVLRWSNSSEEACPITINCWPEQDGAAMNLNLEYEAKEGMVLKNVNIVIPGVHNTPKVISVDGLYKHEQGAGSLIWHNAVVDDNNSSGSLEFNVEGGTAADFFPIHVQFTSDKLFGQVEVSGVNGEHGEGGEVKFEIRKNLSPDSYVCGG
ncbi:hypothetical protein TrCOL_g2900 [Triparma columacea]|uniref:Coatomer subunit delta n=1 Tax=Triparma columacea TaxID=722753 RepID=A0A9W7GD46_9STRA|nr:hypothetical protein TrCOL_g2900 [Triparma columacea]